MKQSDQTIHRFSIYQIKKHTFQPYVFRWTNFYESNWKFQQLHPEIQVELTEDELLICSTVIDADNYSLLTTRRFVTKENGTQDIAHMVGIKSYNLPLNYKFKKYGYIFGTVEGQDRNAFRFFIETGKASMVMTYGIMTFIGDRNIPVLKS